ncbi:hypothetical protein [Oricola sp.]|uniref:hypothetical protein n=1 Tax=Oricola sp. TaxID=1979950 RepID=UPI0025CC5FBE|nr:hypothetical protein [Oricola sp.]MCI5075665.1 hypothetical protein [Oricola sp.]
MMLAFAVSDRLAAGADLAARRAFAQSLIDDINANALEQGVRGVRLARVRLAELDDGSQVVTVEGEAGRTPATMQDFMQARRRAQTGGAG